ncbi:MAG: DNA mismatch repair protein MutS [Erysipelotrichaceae bacterium]|nr:DNA mismatch repair protein MutS [Erysipelotrichaceae bacterium]
MKKYSPMMEHYLKIKRDYQDSLVFYRLGDFYEMFFDDAKIAANELDLVLTARAAGVEDKVPMCGVPYHAVTNYIQRLIQKGHKVAIVEQLEDPKEAKGIVKRDVVRIITPGTIMDELQDEKSSVYIAAIVDYQYGLALAICEMATGETFIKTVKKNQIQLKQQLLKDNIKEIVVNSDFSLSYIKAVRELSDVMISYCDQDNIDDIYMPLCEQLNSTYQLSSYGLLLNYLSQTQKRLLDHLQPIQIDDGSYLLMDYATQVNLQLISHDRNQKKNDNLWSFLDSCQTAMGSRLLKKWIEKPLLDINMIKKRQEAITFLRNDFLLKDKLKIELSNIYDIERLIAKIALASANPIDCLRLVRSLNALPRIIEGIKDMHSYKEYLDVDQCTDLADILNNSISEDAPINIKDGGVFVDGYNDSLDEYRKIQKEGKKWISKLELAEKEKTGIKTLKVGYNRVFGYYFEVSKANMHLIKESDGYIKKQTLANAERFISLELKEKEDAILHSEERALKLEQELFEELLNRVKSYLPKLQKIAKMIATIDVLYALSLISSESGYVLPTFSSDNSMSIIKGRHAIMDKILKDHKYVANDVHLNDKQQIILLTGPNMGGKSTYIRQVALLVVMAQMGMYIPAEKAKMPLFDKIFTRIGASDDILSGQSTFMVEMVEANNALQNATARSLILFDEIGRGTSTYDGMALAQAMIEYIASNIKAKTIFSTHYHELTHLEDTIDTLKNHYVEVFEEKEQVTFLYHVKKGKVHRSYGINVARLAKLPDLVINRSKEILKDLESDKRIVQQTFAMTDMYYVNEEHDEIKEKLKMVDVDKMTPLQALQMIVDLKDELKGSDHNG